MTNAEILEVALAQSALDAGCAPEDFFAAENVFCEPPTAEAVSAYIKTPIVCRLVSYGRNVVASCDARLQDAVKSYLEKLEHPYYAFETPGVFRLNELLAPHGIQARYQAEFFLPDESAVFSARPTCAYDLRILGPEDFRNLYIPAWSNALCKERPQLDVLGVGAYDGDELIGFAACSADCARMWQIGIDVLPEYRGQRLAPALTNRLARKVFERGMVPFYCAAWSNVRSVRNALASGFKPAWVELSARPTTERE